MANWSRHFFHDHWWTELFLRIVVLALLVLVAQIIGALAGDLLVDVLERAGFVVPTRDEDEDEGGTGKKKDD